VLCLSLFLRSGSFLLLIIATKRDDSLQFVSVKLDGKNYSYWSYVMRNFFKGKKVWGYVSGTYVIPKNTEEGLAISEVSFLATISNVRFSFCRSVAS